MAKEQPTDLVARVLAGEQRAAARLMRRIDDRAPGYLEQLKQLHPHTGRAYLLGITGTPGAGKSTLVDCLIGHFRRLDMRVGVVAVDPSSPFSGGAILGDRIRMQRHALDDKVFIRSLSTRGHLGGLSRSAGDVVRVLDAFGCDVVLIESVGVGQDELEISELAHTTVVVLAPGGGDDVQAIKAGILEIADVFAVNKADREGAETTARDLEGMLQLGETASVSAHGAHAHHHHGPAVQGDLGRSAPSSQGWHVPVLKLVASKGEGVRELVAACEQHRQYVLGTAAGRERAALKKRTQLARVFREMLAESAERMLEGEFADAARRVTAGADPYALVEALLARLLGDPKT